jgi:fructosamine-3-kinase
MFSLIFKAKTMFEGEMASIKAIEATGIIRVPHPIKVLDGPVHAGGAMLVMEHVDIKSLSRQNQVKLGKQLAK